MVNISATNLTEVLKKTLLFRKHQRLPLGGGGCHDCLGAHRDSIGGHLAKSWFLPKGGSLVIMHKATLFLSVWFFLFLLYFKNVKTKVKRPQTPKVKSTLKQFKKKEGTNRETWSIRNQSALKWSTCQHCTTIQCMLASAAECESERVPPTYQFAPAWKTN